MDSQQISIQQQQSQQPPQQQPQQQQQENIPKYSPPVFKDRNEQIDAIRRQVEYYFSRENLQTDTFLVSQMDPTYYYVSIDVIASFHRLSRLMGGDRTLLLEALNSSSVVSIDETKTKIRPSIAPKRTTLIVREVPNSVGEQDITELLVRGGIQGIQSVRPDIANTWFVSFNSEEDARNALSYVLDQELGGLPVRARLKTETLLRTQAPVYSPSQTSSDFQQQPQQQQQQQQPPQNAAPYNDYYDSYYNSSYRNDYKRNGGGRGGGGRKTQNYRKPRDNNNNNNNNNINNNNNNNNNNDDRRRNGNGRKRDGSGYNNSYGNVQNRKPPGPVALSPANFPPLPTKKASDSPSDDTKTYSKDELVNVLKDMKIEKPETLPSDSTVIASSADKTLVSEDPSRQSWSRMLSEPVPVSTTSTSVQITPIKHNRREKRNDNNKKSNNKKQNNNNNNNNNKKSEDKPIEDDQQQQQQNKEQNKEQNNDQQQQQQQQNDQKPSDQQNISQDNQQQ